MEERYDRFTNAVTSIYQSIRRIKMMEMRQYGLKSGHVNCLHLLIEHPEGLTSKEITEISEMDKAAVSRYMALLQEKGFALLYGDDSKKYRRRWKLTEEGRKAAEHIDRRIDRAVGAVGDSLSDHDREVLYSSLDEIVANLTRYIEENEKKETLLT